MRELLCKIVKLIECEIDEVERVEFVDEQMGDMCYILLKDGKRVLLSLIDSKL